MPVDKNDNVSVASELEDLKKRKFKMYIKSDGTLEEYMVKDIMISNTSVTIETENKKFVFSINPDEYAFSSLQYGEELLIAIHTIKNGGIVKEPYCLLEMISEKI